jgi:hypothetical protein
MAEQLDFALGQQAYGDDPFFQSGCSKT